MVVTLLPVSRASVVAAFGFDERTVAAWWARSGRQGQTVHEYLVEQPRDLGQVQADELHVQEQGGIVWMALAMMVTTRLWLGGEVSEQRDMPLIRRLIERVRRCASVYPASWSVLMAWCPTSAIPGNLSDPVHTGKGERPQLRPWRNVCIAQSSSATSGGVGRDRTPYCGWRAGTRGDAPTPLARGRGDQHRVHRTAERDISEHLAPLARYVVERWLATP